MSQDSIIIADGTGEAVLLAINKALATLQSQTSGSAAPSNPVAYMFWADTANGKMKQRNAANNAWIERWDLGDGGLNALITQTIYNSPGSFTWTKPNRGTMARVQCWGAGAGGSISGYSDSGGGGGGYSENWVMLASLPATVPVVVGAGGGPNQNGGSTYFGSGYSTAYAAASGGWNGPFNPAAYGGGPGQLTQNPDANGHFFGGGGQGAYATPGNSVWGGGGGGSGTGSTGGLSVYGGNGGGQGANGVAPGGGGGRLASGARGQVIITVF